MLYMPEATVTSAKLRRKSPEELKKMGIGRDETGFYMLASVGVAIPAPRSGVLSTLGAAVNVIASAKNVVEAKWGAQASDAEVARRKSICVNCFEVDGSGKRLFRFVEFDRMSCGQPMDPRVANAKIMRDPKVDGCGCWLQEKWVGRDQACPRSKWGAEFSSELPQRKSVKKRRCCGG